jgi:small-conductance mechanosensitive channel
MTFTRKFSLERHQEKRCKVSIVKDKISKEYKLNKEDKNKEQNKELDEIKQNMKVLLEQNEELKNKLVKLTTKQIPKINNFNKNLKKLEESIPTNSSQLINNHLINKIIEKEKKIDELDNLTKEFMINNFPNDQSNKNIKKNNIILADDDDDNDYDINNKMKDDYLDNDNKPMNLILNNQIIQFRDSDNYINATQLCKAGGKNFV